MSSMCNPEYRPSHPTATESYLSGPFDGHCSVPEDKAWSAMVFVDYLTKWPEVFPTPDQSSATVAKLLVE